MSAPLEGIGIEAEDSLTGGVTTTPGAAITSVPPLSPNHAPVVSDTGIAYISSDIQYPYFAVDRALQQSIDEVERREGMSIYDRMRDEPVMATIERVQKIITLSDGMSVTPSHPKPPRRKATLKQIADYDQAQQCAEYIRAVIDRVSRIDEPILDVAWNLLDGFRIGHKLAEATYDHMPVGEFKGKIGLDSLRCKPRENYAFVVDTQNRFRGVIAKIPGSSVIVWQGVIYDVSQLANAIAPEKLIVFAPDKNNGDPRGQSWWRACFDPWKRKQIRKMHDMNTSVNFAGGKVSVELPDKAEHIVVKDPVTGTPMNLYTALSNSLKNWSNSGYLLLPSGTKLTVHSTSIPPDYFDSGFSRDDRDMVMAVLLSARSILEAKHGSKADSDTAADTVDELKMFGRQKLCDTIRKLFYRLVFMSYGPEIADKYTPFATMQKASRPDFAANATAVAALQSSGYLDPSQQPEIDEEILALPERETVKDPDDPESGEDELDDDQPGDAGAFASAKFRRQASTETNGSRLAEIDEGRAKRAARSKPQIGTR